MASSTPHPAMDQLVAFGYGKKTEVEPAEIADHLAGCATCQQVVETLPDDALLSLIRPLFQPGYTAAQIDSWVPPELIGHPRYHLKEWLGAGGMAVVYKAEHRLMERTVALKVVNRALMANNGAVERFKKEVKAAARLSHPNIVTAYDAEQAGELHFLVMEFVEGVSLARVVEDKGPLPVETACEYIRQAALGLQHAYEAGMVHRDIKPQNLMLTPKGEVKILDFGLAGFVRERKPKGSLTALGQGLGTPDFIAPEQIRDAHAADIRADIYSLGCTLYYLLTGQVPFPEGSVLQKVSGHLERMARPLKELRGDVPEGLVRVIEKMMAKEPEQRYQTPKEVAEAMAALRKGGTMPALAVPQELCNHPRYCIIREIGRGGMGVVYEAEHKQMSRRVALKVINRNLLDNSEAVDRFQSEVKHVARLQHQNIVAAYDAEQEGDCYFLVMEYAEGITLDKLVAQRKQLTIADAVRCVIQAAMGLQHAHESGITHRDIKPANLIITKKGKVKILDFGLSRLTSAKPKQQLTKLNAFMGTAAYVAPEQALDARTADIRADIYSLGCTLYFLLSGRPPFVEETEVKVVLAQIENQAVPIHVIRPDVPTSLSSIVEKMLAKDPGERYQTPAEVAKALSHFLDGVKGVDQSTSVTKQVVIEDINSPIEEKKAQKITGIESHQINQEIAQTNSLVPKQKRSRIPWVLSILGAIMASLTIVYFVVIRVNTKVGTVVIEVDQPSAEVYIDGNLIMVTSPTEKDPIEVKVAEGSHELKVSKGGFQGYTQKFTVTANGKEAIKVSLEQEVQEEVQTPQEDTFLLEKPETQSNLASEYFARKDFSGAAREATKALMQNPKDVSALVARGRAYSMIASERRTSGKNSKVEFDLAIDDYTEAIKLDPFNKDAYAGRIKCYCRINKNNAALKDCNEMIRIDPYDVRGYFMRGETYGIFMNDHAKGLADLNKAMKMSPDASVYITRGRVYLLMKAYDKAISDLTEGLRLGPDKRNRMIGEKALKDAQDSIKKARKKGK